MFRRPTLVLGPPSTRFSHWRCLQGHIRLFCFFVFSPKARSSGLNATAPRLCRRLIFTLPTEAVLKSLSPPAGCPGTQTPACGPRLRLSRRSSGTASVPPHFRLRGSPGRPGRVGRGDPARAAAATPLRAPAAGLGGHPAGGGVPRWGLAGPALGPAPGRRGGAGRRERSCKSHDFPSYINHSLFFSTGCRLKGAVSSFAPEGSVPRDAADSRELAGVLSPTCASGFRVQAHPGPHPGTLAWPGSHHRPASNLPPRWLCCLAGTGGSAAPLDPSDS